MKVLISDPIAHEALEYLETKGVQYTYQPDTSADNLKDIISYYEALLVRSRTKVNRQIIESGKNLRVVARIGSGYDNIDIIACRQKNIVVVNAPDANSISVGELTVGLILSYLRDINRCVISMREGNWIKNEIWGEEIFGKTVGILGYGHVGKKVAKIFEALGANVLIQSRNYQTATYQEVFHKSDIVTIHLSLNSETKGCVSKWLIDKMKPSAILMNLSRGEIVDERALYNALLSNKIRGAILDVFWQEPLPSDSRWRKLPNVILTPHIGAATNEALRRASMTVSADVVRVLKGQKPENEVNS